MSAQDWQADNAHYLAIALEWLRLRSDAPGTGPGGGTRDAHGASSD